MHKLLLIGDELQIVEMSVHLSRHFIFKMCPRVKLKHAKPFRFDLMCARFSTGQYCWTKEAHKENKTGKELDITRESPYAGLTMGQKVKEAGKDASYTLVIIGGVAVTGLMAYTIGKELFSKESSSGVYGQAFKRCQENTRVIDTFGEPLKVHGERTRRGRARHVNYQEFEVDSVKHMRMLFYIEGPHKKGTVHVEVKKNENNKYEFKYVIVELDGYPKRRIVVEENR